MLVIASLWNSVDRLKGVNYFIGLMLVVGAIVGFVVNNRVETLERQIESERDAADERRRLQSEKEISIAKADAAKANEGLAKATLEIENRKNENLRLLQDVETEKYGGAQLLAALSPRNLQWSHFAGKFSEPLSEFKAQKVLIEYLPEAEPRSAAESLAQELRQADWEVEGPTPNENLWRQWYAGVRAEPYNCPSMATFASPVEHNKHVQAMWQSNKAARCVIEFLKKRGWKGVKGGHQDEGELPIGMLRIRVGIKAEPEIPRNYEFYDEDDIRRLIDEGEATVGHVPLQRATPRTISREQRETILRKLSDERKGYNQSGWIMVPVRIVCPPGNDEAHKYACDLAAVIAESGWEIATGSVIIDEQFNRKMSGLVIRGDVDKVPQHQFQAGDIFQALKLAGIESYRSDSGTSQPVQVLVGW